MGKQKTSEMMEEALECLKAEYNASADIEERATTLAEIRVMEWCLGRTGLPLQKYRRLMEGSTVRSFKVGGSKPPRPAAPKPPRRGGLREFLDRIDRMVRGEPEE